VTAQAHKTIRPDLGRASLAPQGTEMKKKLVKNEELINIVFDNFEEIKLIDLNKITEEEVELVPLNISEQNLSMV
jgi:predicted DNA-binding protein (UPF0251 family)